MKNLSKDFKIGCHLSIAGGYTAAAKTAVSIGANTFQYFSRNPRGGSARAVDRSDINSYHEFAEKNGIEVILAHAPYTINACSENPATRQFAKMCITSDLNTMQLLPKNYYNFHPGSHTGQGLEVGIKYITTLLNEVIDESTQTTVLLEAMSGKGSEIGSNFDELKLILNEVRLKDKVGILIDTCHVFSAGYDIVNNLDGVLEEFDKKLGINKLMAIHLNDSMMPFNSKKDRHEKIGHGQIGLDAIVRIINHGLLRDLPFYLETPNEPEGFKDEIELLKRYRNA